MHRIHDVGLAYMPANMSANAENVAADLINDY